MKKCLVVAICLLASACASNSPYAKTSAFCTSVADNIPKNMDLTPLQAYNTCMEMDVKNGINIAMTAMLR
jgi:hypothetical protein